MKISVKDIIGKRILLAITIGMIAMSTNAYAIEPFLQGFSAPGGIASGANDTIFVSNWSGTTVERISGDGSRSVFLDGIASPSGVAIDASGAVFVSSYSGDYIVRIGPDGSRTKIAEDLATPAGIAFAQDGRLLITNRASGEIIALDTTSGERTVLVRSLSLPVGVVEMADGSIVSSQYGGRVTRILKSGETQELGQSFDTPGVGILADGPDAVLVIDYGASVVRRVSFDGNSRVVVDGLSGSAVAMGRASNGDLLVGTWGEGNLYRLPWPS